MIDAYGKPEETWADHLVDEPCRLMAGVSGGNTGTGRDMSIGAAVIVADYIMFIGDVDITEQDRVVSGGVEYDVIMVADRQDSTVSHHKEVWLKAVR